jgi:hypothetical protein
MKCVLTSLAHLGKESMVTLFIALTKNGMTHQENVGVLGTRAEKLVIIRAKGSKKTLSMYPPND